MAVKSSSFLIPGAPLPRLRPQGASTIGRLSGYCKLSVALHASAPPALRASRDVGALVDDRQPGDGPAPVSAPAEHYRLPRKRFVHKPFLGALRARCRS